MPEQEHDHEPEEGRYQCWSLNYLGVVMLRTSPVAAAQRTPAGRVVVDRGYNRLGSSGLTDQQ
jgi:hypothetical protein